MQLRVSKSLLFRLQLTFTAAEKVQVQTLEPSGDDGSVLILYKHTDVFDAWRFERARTAFWTGTLYAIKLAYGQLQTLIVQTTQTFSDCNSHSSQSQ